LAYDCEEGESCEDCDYFFHDFVFFRLFVFVLFSTFGCAE
jgi:hypothetical protein